MIAGPARTPGRARSGLAAASVLVAAGMLASLPSLSGCDGELRFDEPPAAEAGAAEAERPAARCTSDAMCGGLHCETESGACVACLTGDDCGGGLARCDTSLHVCVACLDTADCGPRQRCDATTNRCLDTCNDEDDPCPLPDFVCDDGRHLCVECRSSANCAGASNGSVCDVAIGRCVACTSNAACPMDKPVCDRRTGRCARCVSSAACGDGYACDPLALVCVELP